MRCCKRSWETMAFGLRASVAVVLAGASWACGSSTEVVEPSRTATAVVEWVVDIANNGNASDINVRFRAPSAQDGISGFRVFLVDQAAAGAFNTTVAGGAPASSYVAVPLAVGSVDVSFPATATTASGQAVQDGGSYGVIVESVAAGPDVTGATSAPGFVSLARTNIVRTLTGPLSGGTGGMEVDAEGNIYAADFGISLDGPPGTVVYKIAPSGTSFAWAQGLVGASGNAFDSHGNLLQSNISGARISSIAPDGTVSTFAEGLNGGPVGIAVTPGDTVFVVNCGRNLIQRIGPDRVPVVWSESSLYNCPNGITLADDGNFYVANFGNGNVLKVTPSGAVSVHATLPGGNNGHILFGNGVLYVVARGGHRIYTVTLDRQVTVLAGTGNRGRKDGAALDAELSLTNDVALSPDGTILYFNDVYPTTGSDRVIGPMIVRMILLEGEGVTP